MSLGYLDEQPTREEIDATSGLVAVEFGQNWCGYCRAGSPIIAEALEEHPEVRRIMVADGKGLPLGRSFGIKLWPTMVLLRDGKEVGRVTRPMRHSEVQQLFEGPDLSSRE